MGFSSGHTYSVILVDFDLYGCGGENNLWNGSCILRGFQIKGDDKGYDLPYVIP
ncbi:hypothetical protein Cs7R123_47290 [Catellatospora sp. TT07R-123]|uniref:hypothetical protein n=1 Tax=Catellatospora sp. TT07R-123 TaxID=2733863 RepID=UPI001B244656|nr:hypothetical protein [Catellatospora sp. TT07R-123]GHJ47387.1 hypothetical protein Cs7R123_47290 [Catellatospora sp. TT07R-123]